MSEQMRGWLGRGATLAIVIAAGGACRPVPPPPLMPMHAGTEADERGTVAAMVVVGVVKTGDFVFSGAGGVGAALRVEYQQSDRNAIGVQLGGGRGNDGTRADGSTVRHTLIAVEGYGRRTLADWTAATYGVGVSWFSTGLVTAGVNAGLAVSFPNDVAVPYLRLGGAGVVPIVPGAPFGRAANSGGGPCLACEHDPSPAPLTRPGPRPTAELFLLADLGLVIPIGDRNRLSLDLGFAHAPGQTIGALSVADAVRQDPPPSVSDERRR